MFASKFKLFSISLIAVWVVLFVKNVNIPVYFGADAQFVSFRTLPNIKDSDKEDVIRQAQAALPSWKAMVIQNLTNKGIKVV